MFKPKPQKSVFYKFAFAPKPGVKGELASGLNPISGLQGILAVAFKQITALKGTAVVLSILACLPLGLKLATPQTVSAATPTLTFQARLESNTGAIAPDGNYNIEFNLYEGGTVNGGGTKKWTEDHTYNGGSPDNRIRVVNGYFSVNLGSITNFPSTINWDDDLFLSMTMGGTTTGPITWDSEMTPYLKLTAVPYAFQSQSASQLQTSNSGHTGTLAFDTLTADESILIPQSTAPTDTVCLVTLGNCTAAASSFIQNTGGSLTPQASANFNIQATDSGTDGTIGGIIRAAAGGQTVDLFDLQDASGSVIAGFTATGDLKVASAIDTQTAVALNIGTTKATQINLNQNVQVAASKNLTFASGAGNFDQSASTGTFQTGSGAVSLNGNTTVATGKTFTTNGSGFDASGNLGIGTTAPSTALQVAVNDSSTNSPMALLQQAGSGDSTLEFRNSGSNQSIYIGQDTSNSGAFTIGSSTAANSNTSFGYVQGKINDVDPGGSSTVSLAFDSAVTAGDTVVASVQYDTGAGVLSSCTDSLGNSYSVVLNNYNHTTFQGMGICYGHITTGGSDTVTGHFTSAGPYRQIAISEYSGIVAASPLDGSNSNQASSTTPTSNSITTTTDGDLIYGTYVNTNDATASSSGSGFTSRLGRAPSGSYMQIQDKIQTTAGSVASTNTISPAKNYVSAVVAFKIQPQSITDNYSKALFTLSQTGAATFRNLSDSSNAFQIQNASGTALLAVDTTGSGAITIGQSGSTTTIQGNTRVTLSGDTTGSALVCQNASGYLSTCASAGGGTTLQNAYDNSSTTNPQIQLSSTNGGLKVRDAATTVGNILQVQNSGGTATYLTVTSTGVGINIGSASPTGDLTFGEGANRTINVHDRTTNAAGNDLTVSAGSAGAGAGAFGGGNLLLLGGNAAGTGNANGGDVTIKGGAGVGTGVQGVVNIGPAAFTSAVNTTCASDCTVTQANIDNYGMVIVDASTAGINITLPDLTRTSDIGRVVYITGDAASQDFILLANSGATAISIAMRGTTTATMIWNGSDWTPGGASNATTLQATYNNGTNPSTVPEIKLDSTHGTIDIQDADTSISQDLFNIRGSNAGGLGTVLFGVSDSGQVTVQDTTDQDSSFRVLKANGDYVINVNSNNGYIINNGTTAAGNTITNPGFESGGNITSGEEGWFGPAQASIVNSSSNAHTGNYELQVTPNGTTLSTYAGTYYQVTPGDTLDFEGYVKNSAGATANAGISITWYDKDKAVLSTTTNYGSVPGTSYILRQSNATAPAGAVYARVAAVVSGGGTGTYYFDDFYLKRSVENAPYVFRNSVDSASAFQIQSAGGTQTILTANTSSNILKVGDSSVDNTVTLLQVDSATANPTVTAANNGSIFYRSDNNTLKAVIGGAVVDICTTAVTCSGYSASASSTIQLQASSPGTAQTGNFNITGTGILTQLQTMDLASGNTSDLTIRTGNATSGNSGKLTLDVGTASGTTGAINIGHPGVVTTVKGTLEVGVQSTARGSITLYNTVGNNSVTIRSYNGNPTAGSWFLTLPQDPGNSGDCLKATSGSGDLGFGSCTAGATTNLQDVYNNSSSPATLTLADGKDLKFVAQDTVTDPSVLVNLQCLIGCGTGTGGAGRFAIQDNGTDAFTVLANSGGIILSVNTQVGSSTTDYGKLTLFTLDSFDGTGGEPSCATSIYGSMYYNSSTGTIRSCTPSGWADITNPEQLGLLSFGVVPSSGSGSDPYDLAATSTQYVSGPCRVSWKSNTQVQWEACVAYSGGIRVAVSASFATISTTTTNKWQHLCLDPTPGSSHQPYLTVANSSETANLPAFNVAAPVVCLADILNNTSTNGRIGDLYDTRTFTSDLKEAVTASSAVALGMLVQDGTSGVSPSPLVSKKLYGTVVATDGSTSSTAPNAIITTNGPSWVKATAGTSGDFVIEAGSGYAKTNSNIPNNSFYYSAGIARTDFIDTCTSASNCSSSVYVNFNVR